MVEHSPQILASKEKATQSHSKPPTFYFERRNNSFAHGSNSEQWTVISNALHGVFNSWTFWLLFTSRRRSLKTSVAVFNLFFKKTQSTITMMILQRNTVLTSGTQRGSRKSLTLYRKYRWTRTRDLSSICSERAKCSLFYFWINVTRYSANAASQSYCCL